MFVFQMTNAVSRPSAMTKAELASAVHDYITSAKPVPYSGVPKLTQQQRAALNSLADAAWKQYGFDQLRSPAKDKIRAAFTEEFIRTVYVQAGIYDFVSKKGDAGVTLNLNKGATATLTAGTYSAQVMSDLAAFTAINAAVKGRVGAMRDAYLADNIVLHAFTSSTLAEQAEGAQNPFLQTVEGIRKLRPASPKSKDLSRLSTALDADEKLKGAYNGVVGSMPANAEDIHVQFIEQGYKPTTKSGKVGNVELVFLTGLLKANEEITKLTAKETEKKEEKPVLPGKIEEPRDEGGAGQGTPVTQTLGRFQVKFDSRALKLFSRWTEIAPSAIRDAIPTRADLPRLKFEDPDKFFHGVFGRGKVVTVTSGKDQLVWDGLNYANLKSAVEFFAKHHKKGASDSYDIYVNGKKYGITYTPSTEGNVHNFSITVAPKEMGNVRTPFRNIPEEPVLTITGSYSRTEPSAGSMAGGTLNRANIEMKAGNLSASAYGNYVYDRNTGAVRNGNFGVKLDLGEQAHLYLEGADFNFVKGRFSGFALNKDDPLQSTFKIDGKTISVYDVLHDKAAWRQFRAAAGESFKGGYLSMDAGYGPLRLELEKLDAKKFRTADRVGLTAGETKINFLDNHFKLDKRNFTWEANGQSMVTVSWPDLSEEQDSKVSLAMKKFSDRIGSIDPKRESIYATIRDAAREFSREVMGTDVANTRVSINLPGILGAFEEGSFLGDFARHGLGPSLQKDLPNGGMLSFQLKDMDDLVNALEWKDPQKRWVAVENAIRKNLGIQSGDVFMDNTVMSLYFGGFNTQQEIIDRAITARGAMQAFLQEQTAGTTRYDRMGVAGVLPLIGEMEKKDDFFLYAQLGAAMNEVGMSVFGREANLSNINYVTKSVTLDAGVGARVNSLHLDFGAYGTIDLPYEKLIEVNNEQGGNSFIIPLTGKEFQKRQFRGYLFGRYDPAEGKVQFTVIAGLVPGYGGLGRADYENLRPKVGAQIKLDAPVDVKLGGVKLSPDATIMLPDVSTTNVFGTAGLNAEAQVNAGILRSIGGRVGADFMAGPGIAPVWSPVLGVQAKTSLLKGTDLTLDYRTDAKQLKFGVKAYLF